MNDFIEYCKSNPEASKQNFSSDYTVNYQLSEPCKFELYRALLATSYPDELVMEQAVEQACDIVRQHLPQELKRVLREMRTGVNPPGRLQIANWPVDVLPPTDLSGQRNINKTTYVSENGLLGLTSILGEPYGGLEKPNALVHDVMPVPGARQLTNEGSKVLGLHTELAGMTSRPHWLGFAGLRADPEKKALTAFADIRDALGLLDSATIDVLFSEEFETSAPLKLQRKGGSNTERHTVLTGPVIVPEVRVALYGGLTQGTTERAKKALVKLHGALQQCSELVLLDAGSLVIVNNRLQLHARAGEFEISGLGDDRWFQRVHVAASLWDHRELQKNNRRIFNK